MRYLRHRRIKEISMKRKIYAIALLVFLSVSVLCTTQAIACGGAGMTDGDHSSSKSSEE
jgi:hypothetical protein